LSDAGTSARSPTHARPSTPQSKVLSGVGSRRPGCPLLPPCLPPCHLLPAAQLLGSWDTHASSALPCQLTRLAAQPALRSLDITRNCFAMTLDELWVVLRACGGCVLPV